MKEMLNTVCDIAEQMLKSGAEVHRVEDSLLRMCNAIGAIRSDVFIITSSIVVTVYTENERAYTQTRRIISTGTDIEKLHSLNDLSRRICSGDWKLSEIREEFNRIMGRRGYPEWLNFFAYGLIGGAFTVFFGGGAIEALCSLGVGFLIWCVNFLGERLGMGKIFCRFACSFFATAAAYLFLKLGVIFTVDFVIIGNIMVLIPGIGLTNALRDLFVGDSMAGLLRFIEAVLIALAIAAGHFLFITLFGGVLI